MRCNGFTLIEAIVTAAIAAVVGISIYTLVQLSVKTSNAGILHSMANIKYENTIQQLAYTIRRSDCALKSSELWPPCSLAVDNNVSAIYLKSAGGNDTGGYQISSGILQERVLSGGTWSWQNFKIGDTSVSVTAGSCFTLSSDRQCVGIVLNIMSAYGKLRDTIFARGESFQCRN